MTYRKKKIWKLGCGLLILTLTTSIFGLYLWAQNLGKYTLQPGQSVELKVFSKTEQLEYNSELHFKKLDDAKLKLSGRKGWGMKDSNIVYNVEKQTITELIFLKDKTERKDLPNDKSKSIYLESDGIVLQGEIKEVFGVTEEDPYTITITNVDDKPARFEAQVVNR